MGIKSLLKQTLTEADGVTLCPVRVTALTAVAGYHSLLAFMVGYQHVALSMADLTSYMRDMSVLGTSLGVGVGAKAVMKADAPTT